MKSRIHKELNRELECVHVSRELKSRILSAAAEERFPEKRRQFRLAPLAAAAVLMVICALTLGIVSLRTERIDRRSEVLASGDGDWVWVCDSDRLYHSVSDCGGMSGAVRVRPELAKQDGRAACERCMEKNLRTLVPGENPEESEKMVWALEFSDLYHCDEHCSGMVGATAMTIEEAEALEMNACPVCMGAGTPADGPTAMYVTGTEKLYTPVPWEGAVGWSIAENTEAADVEYRVWATKHGTYYHSDEHCSGMHGATAMSVEEATAMDKTACPTCVGSWELVNVQPLVSPTPEPLQVTPEPAPKVISGGDVVWSTTGGEFYHCDEHCSGMEGARQMTFAEVLNEGKSPCPTCFELDIQRMAEEDMSVSATPEPTPVPTAAVEARLLWATQGGRYYHREENCSGMQGAQRRSLEEVVAMGKEECPVCFALGTPEPTAAPEFDGNVIEAWVNENGRYYHCDEHCSGMQGAILRMIDLSETDKERCPVCYPAMDARCTPVPEQANVDRSFYATENSTHFHAESDCSGMTGARLFSVDELAKTDKKPCGSCLGLGEESWAEYIADESISVRLDSDGENLSLTAVPEPKLEWIDYGLNRPINPESEEIAAALADVAAECMTEDELAEMKALLEAGEIMGFRAVRYNFFFNDEALYDSAEALDDASGDARRHLLTTALDGAEPEAVDVDVIATEIACIFHQDGSADVLTGRVAMVEKSRIRTDEGWLVGFSQERAGSVFPTIMISLPVARIEP